MKIDLTGIWKIELESDDVIAGKTSGDIMLPGILQAQGYGNPVTTDTPWVSGLHDPFWYEREEYSYGQEDGCNVPFLSQPPFHYIGKARYEREFEISDNDEELYLFIELTRWESSVWVDGEYKGSDCSLCSAHQIGIGRLGAGVHKLEVCIDNRFKYPYRPDGHGVSDALGATWNGMAGEIALLSRSEIENRRESKKKYAALHPRMVEVREGCFFVDGEPEYFRGTHFGGDFPLTGYPSTDRQWWDRLMKVVKAWGLNFIRCHSYCPPEVGFAAADEAGVYIQAECDMWNVFNEGIPMLSVLREETRRILEQFGHHPSFVLFSPTNEPDGAWYQPLKGWVSETREYDKSLGYEGRRLYTAQSGWFYDTEPSEISGTDYIYFHRSAYGPILGGNIRNFEGWNGKDYHPSLKGAKLPVICHEMGQWCSYPDFSVAEKFTGYLKPGNYKVFEENAKAHGVFDKNKDFVFCSGKSQVMMYKEDIEANLRTPHLYGFEMLDLHDYLGQGTALVGVLDPFWEEKGYVRPEEFKEFCNETVLLARMPSYVYKNTDRVSITLEVCHFGRKALMQQKICYEIAAEDQVMLRGEWLCDQIPEEKNISVGVIEADFSEIREHKKLTLTARMGDIRNHWDFYVYADGAKETEKPASNHVIYTRDWAEAKKSLKEGKNVVYSPYMSALDYECPATAMRPVFWNAQMGPGWSRGLGLVVEEDHPVFSGFPAEHYGGWQWEDILVQARGFNMDAMPKGLKPVVTVIDDWNRNLPLSLILEARVESGRLLLVSACLEGSFKDRPAAHSLKQALLSYAASDVFCPETNIELWQIEKHLFPTGRMEAENVRCQIGGDVMISHKEALLDRNPNSSVRIEKEEYPIELTLDFDTSHVITGIYYIPDQRDRMHEGVIREYRMEVWVNGEWKVACSGTFRHSFASQKAMFTESYDTDKVKITVLSSYGCGERPVWYGAEDGWHLKKEKRKAILQAAGFHMICDEPAIEDDTLFWSGKKKSTTKEIDE